MSDHQRSLGEDIAFMRSLAEAGRERPMTGGAILLAAGLIFGVASLTIWALVERGIGGWVYLAVWMGALALFLCALFVLLRRLPREGGAYQEAAGIMWSTLGGAIFVMTVGLMIISSRLNSPAVMMGFPTVLMALYGATWLAAAAMLRQGWMRLVGFASFGMALVVAWFATANVVWLIYGLSLLLLLAVPGAVMMRQARRAAGG